MSVGHLSVCPLGEVSVQSFEHFLIGLFVSLVSSFRSSLYILDISFLSKETQTIIQKNISTPMFIAALFTITKIWTQPKCPSIDEWIKRLWDFYTMEIFIHTTWL